MGKVINLVADIGGTNIRLGIANSISNVEHLTVFQCAKYDGLADVVRHYLDSLSIEGDITVNACFAIACPVENDLIKMTNLPWSFSKSALKKELKLNKFILINDYTAIAHAVPYLSDDQKVQVGRGKAVKDKPISICGPGTGLGVANVIPDHNKWISIGGEGGHVDFGPVNDTEIGILQQLSKKYHHVSYEQLLSGLGLEQIFQSLNAMDKKDVQQLSAKEITEKALSGTCPLCEKTLNVFCQVLGSFAGNLALTFGSYGGVYIAGGIVPRFIDFVKESNFRSRFEEKGRLSDFNFTIPTFVITEAQPGILGASAYLYQDNEEEL